MVSKIADRVTGLGVLLALYGIVSSVLYFFDYNIRLLMWVDLWGPLIGWGIRAAFIVGGGALAFAGSIFDKSDSPEVVAAEQQARAEAWDRVKNHPRTQKMFADVSQHMRVTFDAPADSQTYQVRHVVWQDAGYRWADANTQQHYGPDDPRVTNAAFYLERIDAPPRVAVGQDFTTDQISPPHEVHPGTWQMFVGG